MSKKRILIISDFSSIHIFNYVKNVVRFCDAQFVCIHTVGQVSELPSHYSEYYSKIGIEVVSGFFPPKKKGILGKLVNIRRNISHIKSLGKFDVIHVHYVSINTALAVYFTRKQFGRIVLSFWGSDLLRIGTSGYLQLSPIVSVATQITVITEDMMNYFKRLPCYISEYSNKCKVLDFGDMFLDTIDKYKKWDEIKLRESFGLEKNKIVVMIGYNGKKSMQQLEILQELLQADFYFKDKVQFVIPTLYADEDENTVIDDIIEKFETKTFLFRDFMDGETISRFRAATDIFIHGQKTDALSNTMLELLYAGTIVLNGEWLGYSTLDNNNVYYHKFAQFNQITGLIQQIISNIDDEKKHALCNREHIYKLCSWKYLQTSWLNLYRN